MKYIFITSSLNCSIKQDDKRIPTNIDNTNHFVDELKEALKENNNKETIGKIVYIASDPDNFAKTDEYASLITASFNLDGFDINEVVVIDNRFTGDVNKTIMSSDVVYVMGGHVPTQNKFMHKLKLRNTLICFRGIIIGQSAGSMNLSRRVYAPPEEPEDFCEGYQSMYKGMWLNELTIMPHMAEHMCDNIDGKGTNTIDYCLEQSEHFPIIGLYDGSYLKLVNYKPYACGKAVLIKNGFIIPLCEDGDCVKINDRMLKRG